MFNFLKFFGLQKYNFFQYEKHFFEKINFFFKKQRRESDIFVILQTENNKTIIYEYTFWKQQRRL